MVAVMVMAVVHLESKLGELEKMVYPLLMGYFHPLMGYPPLG
jgi:hypothetical protein